MHPKIQGWLDQFEQLCSSDGPTDVYNSLIQLGIEKPNSQEMAAGSGNKTGCDCLDLIQKDADHIQRLERDILLPYLSVETREVLKERLESVKEDLGIWTSMHACHSEYNRKVHAILSRYGIQRVRRICLSDLRSNGEILDGQEYGRVAHKEYGRLMLTFLHPQPKGWF